MKKTALNGNHRRMGARMVEFAGWEMPVFYTGIIEEHNAVRTKVGLFDVSHMGEIEVRGKDSLPLLQKLTPNDVSQLVPGKIQYSALLYPEGTFVDDLLVYCISETHYLLCVNAINTEKDYHWIADHLEGEAVAEERTFSYTQLALQGRKAIDVLQPITDIDLSRIRYYQFDWGKVDGVEAIISRTGYTGEDGFEIYIDPADSVQVWEKLLSVGEEEVIVPVGLGARDTLRLEAKMALYGNDIDHTTTSLEADLEWIVKLEKGDFIGREALLKQKAEGIRRKLVGFELKERGIARKGCPVWVGDKMVGKVTSGTFAPYLKKSIGLTYLPVEHSSVESNFQVEVHGKKLLAEVVPTPFYKKDYQIVCQKGV